MPPVHFAWVWLVQVYHLVYSYLPCVSVSPGGHFSADSRALNKSTLSVAQRWVQGEVGVTGDSVPKKFEESFHGHQMIPGKLGFPLGVLCLINKRI